MNQAPTQDKSSPYPLNIQHVGLMNQAPTTEYVMNQAHAPQIFNMWA
jgi:hypothetical protein